MVLQDNPGTSRCPPERCKLCRVFRGVGPLLPESHPDKWFYVSPIRGDSHWLTRSPLLDTYQMKICFTLIPVSRILFESMNVISPPVCRVAYKSSFLSVIFWYAFSSEGDWELFCDEEVWAGNSIFPLRTPFLPRRYSTCFKDPITLLLRVLMMVLEIWLKDDRFRVNLQLLCPCHVQSHGQGISASCITSCF